ncbi:hypothetical protein ACFL2Q_01755 [Thermodesulfobacteriota bacterium]
MNNLRDHLSKLGDPAEIGANQPISLDGDDSAFLVTTGKIDVFSVTIGDEGRPGARDFVCGIGEGELFFGMPDSKRKRPLRFTAVPRRNTGVLSIRLSDLKKAASDPRYTGEAASLLDLWITKLSRAVSRDLHTPKNC